MPSWRWIANADLPSSTRYIRGAAQPQQVDAAIRIGMFETILQELDGLLADPSIINDQDRFRELSKEHAVVRPVVSCFNEYRENLEHINSAKDFRDHGPTPPGDYNP